MTIIGDWFKDFKFKYGSKGYECVIEPASDNLLDPETRDITNEAVEWLNENIEGWCSVKRDGRRRVVGRFSREGDLIKFKLTFI
jgi:hypothetical protein